MYRLFIKRILDFFVALFGLAIALPILLVLIIILAIANRGSAFFFQKRPGKNEKLFSIIKLKTMDDNMDANGKLLPDEDRLTKVGQLVRKTSLDELPQLINVLKGDMSLVGPRPLLISYLPLYNNEQKKRHQIRPGITGWAQVNGRNTIAWKQKFEYDIWYVENCSFALDIKILRMTFLKALKRDGISSGTSATMETFTGN